MFIVMGSNDSQLSLITFFMVSYTKRVVLRILNWELYYGQRSLCQQDRMLPIPQPNTLMEWLWI